MARPRKWLLDNENIFHAYLGGESGYGIAKRMGIPQYAVYHLLEYNGVWRPPIDSAQRMSELWRDPNSVFNSPEYRSKMSAANKIMSQRPSSYPAGLTHRIPKGAHISPGTELKKGDPRTRAIAIKARSHVKPRFRDTSIERAMQKGLSEKGLAFQTHLWVEGSNPDIIFADQKIAIFCDGDYWHNLPSYKRRDQEFNKRLGTAGWMVLRFWEHEIVKNVNKCIARVMEVIANRNSSTPENDPVVK